jgi:serine/threonine protein kinase
VCIVQVIHRDLKLENVLLQGPNATTMVAKVADFGLCACVDTWIARKRTAEGE